MNDVKQGAERIAYLTRIIPPLLFQISETEFAHKPAPQKWSKKQIIGHLVDSATNNHHRFIRSRIETSPNIFYDQDEWNNLTHYNEMNSGDLIHLWEYYNKLIAHIILYIKPSDLQLKCRTGENEYTLEYLILDYVKHLEHHLRQVLKYD